MKSERVEVDLDPDQLLAVDHYRLEHHCSRDEFLRKILVPWELSLNESPVPIPLSRWMTYKRFFFDCLRLKERL
jgi:hypothetical protein